MSRKKPAVTAEAIPSRETRKELIEEFFIWLLSAFISRSRNVVGCLRLKPIRNGYHHGVISFGRFLAYLDFHGFAENQSADESIDYA